MINIIGFYIDDDIISSMEQKYNNEIILYLNFVFKQVTGTMDHFIGFQLQFDQNTSSIFIYQSHHISDIIRHFEDAHEVSTWILQWFCLSWLEKCEKQQVDETPDNIYLFIELDDSFDFWSSYRTRKNKGIAIKW